MARLARVVVPDHPHHVTQRGNGRARTLIFPGHISDICWDNVMGRNYLTKLR